MSRPVYLFNAHRTHISIAMTYETIGNAAFFRDIKCLFDKINLCKKNSRFRNILAVSAERCDVIVRTVVIPSF